MSSYSNCIRHLDFSHLERDYGCSVGQSREECTMSADGNTLTEMVMLTKYFMSFIAFCKLKRVKESHVTYLASGKIYFTFSGKVWDLLE